MNSNESAEIPSRLLAITYDILIVFFIIVITNTVVALMVSQGKELPANHIVFSILKSFWIFLSFLYFAYYWTQRGQTPGMKVWKIKLINQKDTLVSWPQALIRYVTAICGIGLFWMFLNKDRFALQDSLSKSSLIKV